jgi:hypothetical protein
LLIGEAPLRFINFSTEKFILVEDEDLMHCVTETVTKMIEALPEPLPKKVLEEITPIISDIKGRHRTYGYRRYGDLTI